MWKGNFGGGALTRKPPFVRHVGVAKVPKFFIVINILILNLSN